MFPLILAVLDGDSGTPIIIPTRRTLSVRGSIPTLGFEEKPKTPSKL